jgi:hypothetical protein
MAFKKVRTVQHGGLAVLYTHSLAQRRKLKKRRLLPPIHLRQEERPSIRQRNFPTGRFRVFRDLSEIAGHRIRDLPGAPRAYSTFEKIERTGPDSLVQRNFELIRKS